QEFCNLLALFAFVQGVPFVGLGLPALLRFAAPSCFGLAEQSNLFLLGGSLLKEHPSRNTKTQQERQGDSTSGRKGQFVPPNHFLEPINVTRRTGHNR